MARIIPKGTDRGFRSSQLVPEQRLARVEETFTQQGLINQQRIEIFSILSEISSQLQELRNSKDLGQGIWGSGMKNDRRFLSSESRNESRKPMFDFTESNHQSQRKYVGVPVSNSTCFHSSPNFSKSPNPTKKPSSGETHLKSFPVSPNSTQISSSKKTQQRCSTKCLKEPLRSIKNLQGIFKHSKRLSSLSLPQILNGSNKENVGIENFGVELVKEKNNGEKKRGEGDGLGNLKIFKKKENAAVENLGAKIVKEKDKFEKRREEKDGLVNFKNKENVGIGHFGVEREKEKNNLEKNKEPPWPSSNKREPKLKKRPWPISSKRKPKFKKSPRPISGKKKKKPNKKLPKLPFLNDFSSTLILKFPPNFVRQLSNKARRNCGNIGVAQVVAASWANSPSSDALISISASEAEEEAGSVALPREDPEFSLGLNWALAGRGVIVKDKVLHNLDSSELQKKGATRLESLFGIPLHVRGNSVEGASKISRAQFAKLLKQVTCHISSVSNVFVQDGAVASAAKCDAKVRVITDSPSAVLSLSHILWETHSRAVSYDSCPLIVYVASISQVLGLATQASTGFAVADIERSSLILCGRAFADANATRDALVALAAPLISARGGLLLAARLLEAGDSMILLFASEDIIRTCFDLCQALVIRDAGVVLSSDCLVPFSRTRGPAKKFLKKLASVIIASTDSTGVIPLVLKLSSGQAAYHFLASYQDGKFLIAFSRGPSPLDPLVLAKALLSHLKNNEISSFSINVNSGVLIIDESEQILDMRLVVKGNHLTSQVPIKWKQRTHLDSTWEFYWDLVKGFHTFDLGTRSKLRGGNC